MLRVLVITQCVNRSTTRSFIVWPCVLNGSLVFVLIGVPSHQCYCLSRGQYSRLPIPTLRLTWCKGRAVCNKRDHKKTKKDNSRSLIVVLICRPVCAYPKSLLSISPKSNYSIRYSRLLPAESGRAPSRFGVPRAPTKFCRWKRRLVGLKHFLYYRFRASRGRWLDGAPASIVSSLPTYPPLVRRLLLPRHSGDKFVVCFVKG